MFNVVIGYLKVNSIRNKFHMLPIMIKASIGILMVSKTNLNSSFPQFYDKNFMIKNYMIKIL